MAGKSSTASRFRAVWASRRTLRLLVLRDVKVKYADSELGYVWSVLEPLMLAGVYWFVFTQIFTRSVGEEPYILFLLCGVLPWQWANGGIRNSLRALSRDSRLVRWANVPRELWVLRTVGAKFVDFLFSMVVITGFAVAYRTAPSWYIVFFPLAVLMQATLLVGVGLVLSPLAAMFSDVQRLVKVALRLVFYFSPIIYGVNDVEKRLGETIAKLYILNPLAGIFDLYRSAFFPDQWAGWDAVVVSAGVSLLIFALGLWVFSRLEGAVLKEI